MFKKVKRYWYNLTHPVIGEVWELHRVRKQRTEREDLRLYEITPSRLENLIITYLRRGYIFVSMADVHDYLLGVKKVSKKFIAVTLDDGYEDNLLEAFPIFVKYQVPFCIYIAKQYITREKEACDDIHYNMLSIDQIKQLLGSPLCTIGAHTVSHAYLSKLSKEDQMQEMLECKQWLESVFNQKIVDFAYPYGDYNQITLQVARDIGIQQAVASWGGRVRKDANRVFDINRIIVTENKKIL